MGTNVFALMVGQRAIEKLQKCFWKDKSPTGGWNERGRGKKKLSERRNFWRRAPFSIIYLLSEIKLLSDADTKNATKLETISNTIKQFRIFLNMSNKYIQRESDAKENPTNVGGWNITEHHNLRQREIWTDHSMAVPDASSLPVHCTLKTWNTMNGCYHWTWSPLNYFTDPLPPLNIWLDFKFPCFYNYIMRWSKYREI